ncbi:MAG: IS30 family transposase, partial [Anderseniella sp.]
MSKYRKRNPFTESEKEVMWDRWRQGDSLYAIAHLLGATHTSIRRNLLVTGGIQPPRRHRSRLALSLSEREEISRGIVAGHSIRFIARTLGRAPSTVSRELSRNGGRQHYRACQADQATWHRAQRPKRCKLVTNRALARIVAAKLRLLWSPEQIAGWLKRTYPDDESFQVSHETIYRSLFVQARGALKKELLQHLRRTRTMRRSRHYTQKTPDHGRIKNTVSILQRPAEAADRAVPGHWEGDLLCGNRSSQILSLVERHSRYVMLARLPSKDPALV